MDFNAINGPKLTPEQLAQYLERIGLSEPPPHTVAGLTQLMQAHQQTVPFENLDILAGIPISLEHEALFDKIVRRRRGGVCSELNTSFTWLLYSLGFEPLSCNSRIIPPTGQKEFRRHRVMVVELEGRRWLVDVGNNLERPRVPLPLEEGAEVFDGRCRYRIGRDPFYGWVQYQQKMDGSWIGNLGFTEEPQIDLDFVTPTFYYEKHPASVMNHVPRISLFLPDDFYAVRSHCLQHNLGADLLESIPLTEEEEKAVILERFGLVWPGPGAGTLPE